MESKCKLNFTQEPLIYFITYKWIIELKPDPWFMAVITFVDSQRVTILML